MTVLPATTIFVGSESEGGADVSPLVLPAEVGALLVTEGFWLYCQEHVLVKDKYVFHGPFEAGRIESDELLDFINATQMWASKYETAGIVSGVYSGTSEEPRREALISNSMMHEALGEIRSAAEQALQLMTYLYIVT